MYAIYVLPPSSSGNWSLSLCLIETNLLTNYVQQFRIHEYNYECIIMDVYTVKVFLWYSITNFGCGNKSES